MCKGMVFNIQKFSIHDGPGIRTTVFLKAVRFAAAGVPIRSLSFQRHRYYMMHLFVYRMAHVYRHVRSRQFKERAAVL